MKYVLNDFDFPQLLGDVPEEDDTEDAELQASIASANRWRKMAALTRQRATEVSTLFCYFLVSVWYFCFELSLNTE